MLESELGLALATAHRAEEAHQVEVSGMEADIMKAAASRRYLLEKLQQVEVVEDAMRDLYVQMQVGMPGCSARPAEMHRGRTRH